MENQHYPFVNLPLPYAYNALEPFIDEKPCTCITTGTCRPTSTT